MIKKLIPGILLFIILSFSIFGIVLNKSTAAANYGTISSFTYDQQIASYEYYSGLNECISKGYFSTNILSSIDLINTSVVFPNTDNYQEKYFNDNFDYEVNVGYIAKKVAAGLGSPVSADNNGIMQCQTIADAALKLWKINDNMSSFISSLYEAKSLYVCQDWKYDEAKQMYTYVDIPYEEWPSFTLPNDDINNPLPTPREPGTPKIFQKGAGDNEAREYCWRVAEERITYSAEDVDEDDAGRVKKSDDGVLLQKPGTPDYFNKTDGAGFTVKSSFAENFKNYIKTNIYNNSSEPSLSNLQYYYLYYSYVFSPSVCNSKNYGPKVTNTKDDQAIEKNAYYKLVSIIKTSNGEVSDDRILFDQNQYKVGTPEAPGQLPLMPIKKFTTCWDAATKLTEYTKKLSDEKLQGKVIDFGTLFNDTEKIKTGLLVGEDNETTTCAIDGVGWLICPVVNFLAKVIDDSWGILSGFLDVDSNIVSTTNTDGNTGPTYKAWQMVRNIANVAFAIVFLIIIFSQVTSFGMSNYGIKKMLPKLIIAAILVNLSFYICQIAVDISNILGYSIKNIFDNLTIATDGHNIFYKAYDGSQTGEGLAGIAGTVLTFAGGGIYIYAQIGALIPVLLGGIVAVLMILFMLVGRQALIILLVVISPLAFVAYLLPNTSKLFDKWKKLLTSLLLLFPIVALVVGASSLASSILSQTFMSSTQERGITETLGQIAAAAVAILPLFVVPGMLKKSLDGAGNIGGTLNKLSDKWGKGLGSKYTNSDYEKYRAAKKADDNARIKTGNYNYTGKNPFKRINNVRSRANKKFNSSVGLNGINGGFGSQRVLVGQGQDRKDQQDSMALLNNDDELAMLYAETGGDIKKLSKYAADYKASHGGKDLSQATIEQFKLMHNAGYHNKANTHLATAKYLSENGKGTYAQFKSALNNARAHEASEIAISSAQGAAVGAYRKSGRGDALAQLSYDLDPSKPLDVNGAWASVNPTSLHRDAISDKTNITGRTDYGNYLLDTIPDKNGVAKGYEATRKALASYEQMESRTQESVSPLLIAAANKHLAPILAANATRAAEESKAADNTEMAAIAAATAVGATSADKLAAATATAAATAARDKAAKANAIVRSGITQIREAKEYFGIR